MILGVPDEQESLRGAVSDTDKLNKIWEKLEVRNVVGMHCRLTLQDELQREHSWLNLRI